MASTVEDLKAAIESRGAEWLIGAEMAVDGLSLTVALDHIVEVLTFLREDPACDFSTLTDITAVDWPGRAVRFEMVYHMLSMHQNHRIRVKADVPEGVMVPSVVGIWPSANWYEREVFDMYGVLFTGHPDLRRILTDYGFSGFPLRKDFPTTGYVEVRYDEEAKSVVYEPVELTQEYRQFDFMSPWEGAEYILPGDEKKEA